MSYSDIVEIVLSTDISVTCIKENQGLTVGKTYPVIKKLQHPDYSLPVYRIINDKEVETNYFKTSFKENKHKPKTNKNE